MVQEGRKTKNEPESTPPSEFYGASYSPSWWKSTDNQRNYVFNYLNQHLAIRQPQDWYLVSREKLIALGGTRWLNEHEGKIHKALEAAYPLEQWMPSRFVDWRLPNNFWTPLNLRNWLEWAKTPLGVSTLDDWYRVSSSDIEPLGGARVLHSHEGSLHKILIKAYPDHQWAMWKFSGQLRQKWASQDNERQLIQDICERHKWSLDELYDVSYREWARFGAAGFFHKFNSSPFVMLQSLFPEHRWFPWKFKHLPSHWFADPSRQRDFAQWFEKEVGFKAPEDWYGATVELFDKHGGLRILAQYPKAPILSFVTQLYPNHTWHPWKFKCAPNNWWTTLPNQREYLLWLGKQLGFTSMDAWYRLTYEDLTRNKGSAILRKYKESPSLLVMTVLKKDHDWLPWRFTTTKKGWWNARANQLVFFEWLKRWKLAANHPLAQYEGMDAFYEVDVADVIQQGGRTLMKRHGDSLYKSLLSLYPQHKWMPWKFRIAPRGFWNHQKNRRAYLEWLMQEEGWATLAEFRDGLTGALLQARQGGSLLVRFEGSITRMLQDSFPEFPWQTTAKSFDPKIEALLFKSMKKLYPAPQDVVHSVWNRKVRKYSSQKVLEFDAFVKSCNLAVEYQGNYHFFDIMTLGECQTFTERDLEKALSCARQNVALIEVPYWWDLSLSSLVESVRELRPESLGSAAT